MNLKATFMLLVAINYAESINFKKTNLVLYRPVVVRETVSIDCSTNPTNVDLKLLKRNQQTKKETVLKPNTLNLVLEKQVYKLLISETADAGEYICVANANGLKVQKSLIVYIAGEVSGDIPKPVVTNPVTTIKEGHKLTLKCSTNGTFAKLVWKKGDNVVDATKITNKEPYFKDGTIIVESLLTIEDVSLADVGLYSCESVSRFDGSKKAVATAQLNVDGLKLYWINNKPESYNAVTTQVESAVIISCALSHPSKKVNFYNTLRSDDKQKIRIDGIKYQLINNQELVILRVSLLDQGDYECEVNDKSIPNKKVKLFVNNYGAKKPSVFVKPKTLSLDYNAAENVTCKTYGNNAQVQWLRKMTVDGEVKLDPVPTEKVSGKMTRTNTGYIEKKYIMALQNVTPKDTGTYICKVTVNGKPAFSDLQLTVEDPLSPEIKKFSSKVIKEKKSTSLNCRSKGAPKPQIQFYKDGSPIRNGENGYKIDYKRLVIPNPEFPDHDGIYTCSVSNMFGKATGDAKLAVTVSPVIDKSKDIIVVGDPEKLKVTCNIRRSNPVPEIMWEYQPSGCQNQNLDCKPIEANWINGEEKDITSSSNTSTFKVPPSSVKKFFVRCTAKHDFGSDRHQVFAIIDKRDAKKYLISSPLKLTVDEQEDVQLTCRGKAGLFSNLTWVKDSALLLTNSTDLIVKNTGTLLQDKVSQLFLKNVSSSQTGNYSCYGQPTRAEDSVVVTHSEVHINEIYAPKILRSQSRNVTDGKRASILFEIDAHPAPNIIWLKNEERITNVGRLLSESDCGNSEKGKYFTFSRNKNQIGRKLYELVICKASWEINNGIYTCIVNNTQGQVQGKTELHIYASPKMSFKQVNEYVAAGKSFIRNCTASGYPTPFVWWEKKKNGAFHIISTNSSSGMSPMNITSVGDEHYGDYRCIASNAFGEVLDAMLISKPKTVTVAKYKSDDTGKLALLIAALVASLLIIIILAILAFILYKRRKLYGGFYILSVPPSPDYFRKIDPTKSLTDQVHKLPYFPEWEFPRDKVKIKNQVGSGAFGEVYIADAVGIQSFDPRLRISMKHKPMFSRKGLSLSYYFRSNRTRTLSTGQKNYSVRSHVSRHESSISTKSTKADLKEKTQAAIVAVKKLKEDATTTEYKDLVTEMKILIHIGQHANIVNLLGACTKGIEKDIMVILEFCPYGNLLSFMKERRQLFKPIWSKQHVGIEKEFTTFDLCVAAYQIAKGLEFLASRKCVHRDVAARNVLVGDNFVMKVADFGLARDICQDERYVKLSGGLLPIKWMAIESIYDRVFTQKSDVWSYGVLLWELMTLGGSPYPGIPAKELSDFLSNGYRMDQPQFCPNEMYALMRECWNDDENQRPSFYDIVLQVARVIESHCDPEEVDCYLDKHHIIGGSFSLEDDYLRPVDSAPGSYRFSPPPTYLQSFGDPKVGEENKPRKLINDGMFERKSSERYVPDPDDTLKRGNKRITGTSEKEVEKSTKLGELQELEPFVENSDFANEALYVNEDPIVNNNIKEQIDENSALLDHRSPSPVEEFSNFIDDQYEKMGSEGEIDI